jgi:hypothetical protein
MAKCSSPSIVETSIASGLRDAIVYTEKNFFVIVTADFPRPGAAPGVHFFGHLVGKRRI